MDFKKKVMDFTKKKKKIDIGELLDSRMRKKDGLDDHLTNDGHRNFGRWHVEVVHMTYDY